MLIIWYPIWLTKFIQNYIKIIGLCDCVQVVYKHIKYKYKIIKNVG